MKNFSTNVINLLGFTVINPVKICSFPLSWFIFPISTTCLESFLKNNIFSSLITSDKSFTKDEINLPRF